MKNITEENSRADKKTAVAMGIFDGFHTGHRAVFSKLKSFEKNGLLPAVFTFVTESIVKKHDSKYRFIISNDKKLSLAEQYGVEYVYCPDFADIKDMSAEQFASEILAEKLNASAVVCGPEFRFGKGASCGIDELRKLGEINGFSVKTVEPVNIDNIKVSSTLIKELISSGDIRKANMLLGYSFVIDSTVVHGNEIGRTIDFPTLNQSFLPGQVIPRYGVYATETVIDGRSYASVTNVGVKPTIKGSSPPLAETHILGYKGDLYGTNPEVRFTEFIRPECRFSSLDELRDQIRKDIQTASAVRR